MVDFARVFYSSRDIGFITDLRGAVQAATAGAERALSFTQAELLGFDLPQLDASGALGRFFESAVAKSRMSVAFRLRARSGEELSLTALASSLREADGTPSGWFLLAQDLRGALAEARNSRPILDALVDSIGAAVWSFDRGGKVILWGRACEKDFGIARADAEGKFSVLRLFASPEEFRRVTGAVDATGHFAGELLLRSADGTARLHHVSATALSAGGLEEGYTCVSFDVVEQRKAGEFFQVLFQKSTDPVYIVDDEMRVVEVNQEACRLLGYTREEFLRLTVPDLVPPELRYRIDAVRKSIGEGPPYMRDRRMLLRKDGSSVATDQAIARVEISGQKYFIASSRDLTDLERSARELEEAKSFLEHVQESANDGLALFDDQGLYISVNRKLLEMRGQTREEVVGRPYSQNEDPKRIEEYRRYWERLMRGERVTMRTTIERPDREPVIVDVNSAPVDRGGRRYVFAIIHDVTERVKSEEALRQAQAGLERRVAARTAELQETAEKYRAIVESTGVGVWHISFEGRTIYANPAMVAMLGLEKESDLEGRLCTDFFDPETVKRIRENLSRRKQGEATHYEVELKRADGTPCRLAIFGAPVLSPTGQPVSSMGTFIDVTEQKKSEVLLRRAHEELERRVSERTAELARANELLQEEVAERKRAESALRLVLEGTAASTGGSFFRSLTRHLASAFGVRYALVLRAPIRGTLRLRTAAFWKDDGFHETMEYDGAGTPCEDVLGGEACSYSHDVQRLFPEALVLSSLGAESYMGVPLLDSTGTVTGVLCVLDDKPIGDEELKLSLMKVFAARAGAEQEREQAEEALRESEERWRSLVVNAPDIITTVDREGHILSINRTFPGSPPDAALGRLAYDFVPGDSANIVRAAVDRVFQNQTSESYMVQAPSYFGGLAWYSSRIGPVVVNGKVVAATIISRDVTEQYDAEKRQALQHALTLLLAEAPTLDEAMPGILRQAGEDLGWSLGLFWEANASTAQLRLRDSWQRPNLAGAADFLARCRTLDPQAGTPGRGEAPLWISDLARESGEPRLAAAAAAGFRSCLVIPVGSGANAYGLMEFFSPEERKPDDMVLRLASTLGGQVGQYIGRKHAERDLRFQKSILESQSEAAIDGILVVSLDGRMTSFNRRFLQMWDIPSEVLESRSDDHAIRMVMSKLVDQKGFVEKVRYLYDRPDEESRDEILLRDGRTFDRYSAPVKGPDGDIYGRVWYFRDVTGRKQTEENLRRAAEETRRAYEDLQEAQAQLIRSEKLASIGMLVSGVAHEINNPLNVMYGNLQLLAEVSDVLVPLAREGARVKKIRGMVGRVAKFRGMIRDALKAARHAREIVHDFRSFARDTRTAELVDLNRCLEEAVTLIQRELKPGVRVLRKLGRLPQVPCLRGQISQVFLNLLKNADEAIERKGTITLRTFKKDGFVSVEVSDTGRGMPEDVRRKLFEPFFTTKPVGKGLGLGLSISAMIVQNHNGRITVKSSPGKGSSFIVELPLDAE